MPIQIVESQRLYRQIAGQLRGLINDGEFGAGDRLPAERDLAKQLGVSRPSVREALIALEVEGWVEVRTGSGVYVRTTTPAPTQSAPRESEWGPLELIRARRTVEGETAAMAALQRKRSDIDAMNDALVGMLKTAEDRASQIEFDRMFHLSIAHASGNAVLFDTVDSYWESRNRPVFRRLDNHFDSAATWKSALAEHEIIRDTIMARDAQAAREAMHVHLDRAHQRFSTSWRHAGNV